MTELTSTMLGRMRPRLIAFARSRGTGSEAEDVAQETFALALEAWRTDPPSNPEGWLMSTCAHVAADHLRKMKRRRAQLQRLVDEERCACHANQTRSADLACMLRKPGLTRTQVVVVTAYAFGASTAQIADQLRIAEVTVRAHLAGARRVLRAEEPGCSAAD